VYQISRLIGHRSAGSTLKTDTQPLPGKAAAAAGTIEAAAEA